jgi:hypothetical protein
MAWRTEILFRIRNKNECCNTQYRILCEAAFAGRLVMAWGSANFSRPTDSYRELGGPPLQVSDIFFVLERGHIGSLQDFSLGGDPVTIRDISSRDRGDALAWDNHSYQVQRICGRNRH